MSIMIKDLVMAYQFGLKQLYYFNTHDGSEDVKEDLPSLPSETDDEDCDSCTI